MRRKIIFSVCATFTFVAHAAPLPIAADDTCDLGYQIEAKWHETPRRFDVILSFDTDAKGEALLIGPKRWAGVDDFDKTILDVRVVGDGVSLMATESNQWFLSHDSDQSNGRKRVTVKYSIVNGVPNIDDDTPIGQPKHNTLAKDHFHLIGNGAFVGPRHLAGDAGGARATCITFSGLPTGWSFASSFGVGQQSGVAKIRAPGGLNLIFNAVYLGGDYRILRREIEGKPLFMALRGAWSFADEKFADATATLVRAHRAFWNDFDFPHYLIALAPNRFVGTSYGGTGLHNAFTMHASPNFMVPGAQFDYLIGHEHLHTWMPRRVGSMGGNDQQLRYWFSEGFTNYLTHRLLLQSGLWSLHQYAESLNDVIAAYLTSPEVYASNERVLKAFWGNRGSVGYLPYQRGELLALRWANQLLRDGKSLEQHLQKLVAKAEPIPSGGNENPDFFATTRLRSALRADLGSAADADIETYIERGETLPMNEQFLGPCFDGKFQQRALFELGFESKSPLVEQAISGVIVGGQAERAGLRDGMTVKSWSSHNNDSTREITVTVTENDATRVIKFFPASAKTVRIPVFMVKADAATSAACAAWLPKSR